MEQVEINTTLLALKTWTMSVSVGGAILVLLGLIRQTMLKRLRPNTVFYDFFKQTKLSIIVVWALYVGLSFHTIPPSADLFADRAMFLISMLQIGIWSRTLISYWLEGYLQDRMAHDASSLTTMGLIGTLVKFGLYSILFLLTLNNFGVNITALVAGLGVGGIAVALAVQNILADLFASLTIVLDKPFIVGDQIFAGDNLAVVERIGLKTTQLRNQSGEQLIFPNGDLIKSRIRNFKRMDQRRMSFLLHVEYTTALEKLKKIPKAIEEIVAAHPRARLERCVFKNHGYYSLEFEVVYWTLDPEYNPSIKIHQDLLFEIHDKFQQQEINWAYCKQAPPTAPQPEAQPFFLPVAKAQTDFS